MRLSIRCGGKSTRKGTLVVRVSCDKLLQNILETTSANNSIMSLLLMFVYDLSENHFKKY